MSTVAAIRVNPDNVLDGISRGMHLVEYQKSLDQKNTTILKTNISWQHFFPACSTTPWQFDGVISELKSANYTNLLPAYNGTVVVNPIDGAKNNKHTAVEEKHELKSIFLDFPPTKWIKYTPKAKLLVLDTIFPEGIRIPEVFIGSNIIHLPTAKTHVFTTMTGAMKNAFGGLLNHKRHWTHSVIHETLVDLLKIQKEIHPEILAVTDATFAGDGPGPRAMQWHIKNLILVSKDQVAIDAVCAHLMGFDPFSIKFIKLAHDEGLGCGDINKIQIVGDSINNEKWNFNSGMDTLASKGQKLIYWGPLKRLEKILLQSPIVPWSFWASNFYYNTYWMQFIGKKRVNLAMETEWGELFKQY
mgnify:FL=1|tara:strand:- start:331 stop:1404 length:1074 start_codon:yes stop_codon:yes gene_type:complete